MDLEAKDAPMEDLGDPFHQVEVVDVDDADAGADTPNKEGAPQEGVEIKDAAEDMSEAKASHHCHNKPITGDPEKESNLEDLQDIAKELDEISEEVPGQAQQADQEEPALPESSAQIPVIQKLPTEQEEHPFAVYYCAESSEEWPRHPAAQAVESITLAQIQKARNATIAAITAPHTVRERPREIEACAPVRSIVCRLVVVRKHPTEKGDLARLAPQLRNIPSVNGDNNAMRALATLSEADTLPPLPPQNVDLNANRTVYDLTLSDQQMLIINTLSSNNFTALAIDCGPGTGNTTIGDACWHFFLFLGLIWMRCVCVGLAVGIPTRFSRK
uniref:Uncharacterized protein n=1 Tax=Caenorhabditis japonica TaxID=281687 RepID=A0A8R1IDI8_CAEJA